MTSFSAGGNAYDDHGNGDLTFLFLPGWCGPRTYFGALTDRLSAGHRTLTIDWRGHGESEPATGDFGVEDLVDDAVALIEETGARRVVPVAAAHAGWVAIELGVASAPTWSPASCSSTGWCSVLPSRSSAPSAAWPTEPPPVPS